MNWPPATPAFLGLVALFVLLVSFRERRHAHRCSAVNRALHELRRPLQIMALAAPGGPRAGVGSGRPESALPVWQAIRALGDVERQLNGGPARGLRDELIACRLMTDACVRRWRSRAHLAGAAIELRWAGPDALIRGDGAALAAALENLILNAIEHGGPAITVNALRVGRRLRIEVLDNGRSGHRTGGRGSPAGVISQLRGSSRHGHGLEVVQETVRRHGGRFELEIADSGSKAILVLPVGTPAPARRSGIRVNW
jgi:hypothetical protein